MIRPNPNQQAGKKRPASIAAFTIAMAALLLVACGGGGSEGSAASSGGGTAGSGTVTPAKVTLPQVLQDPAYTPVVDTTYLSVASSAAQASKAAAAASPAPTITPTELLNWAEAMFPQRFPAGPQNQTQGALTFRYYPGSDSYVGIANNVIYAFGADTANRLVNAGNLSDFNCTVKPGSCTVIPVQAFTCDSAAITCVEVVSTASAIQSSVPVTFGQPFKAGTWKHQTVGLNARDNLGQSVSLQADEISSHRDGSARFAVLSSNLENLQPNERRIINIFKGATNTRNSAIPSSPTWDMEVTAKIYTTQVTKVKLGNRDGQTAGISFLAGEKITIKLEGTVTEQFTHSVRPDQAGGGHITLTVLAQELTKLINEQSTAYSAEKIGTGGGYENLWIKTRNPAGGTFKTSFAYSGLAQISQVNTSDFSPPKTWVFHPQEALKQQIALSNSGRPTNLRRMHGSVATEFTLSAPLKDAETGAEHPHLTARLDTRLYENGQKIRTDVVMENNWTFKQGPKNITYELTIKQGGKTAHHQPVFTHFHHARWHKVVWAGVEPKIQLRHNMDNFMASRAVWNYDRTLAVSETTLAAEATNFANRRATQAQLGPMGNVFLQTMFGTTGGRPDIGPFPRWTALYLITQDERAKASMFANADAAAAVPIHYRDENTDQPIDPVAHRTLTVYWNAETVPSSNDPTIWAPDTAHQASFTYVPYLLTGDRFYQDEMMFWASWNVITLPSGYRSYEKALVNRHQVRGQAWALRSLFEAHATLADTHPMKLTFRTMLDNNLAFYRQTYVNGTTVSPLGLIQHSATSTGPWMNDFVGSVMSLIAENDEPNARETLDWISRFNVGRFMSDTQGFCAARAPGYYWKSTDTGGEFLTTWSNLFASNYPADIGKSCDSLTVTDGYPTGAAGYAAYARAMLGAATNAGVVNASAAYVKWKEMTPFMDKAFETDPTWAITPR